MPVRRTGIGMLLSGLLGGRPSVNPAAGADEDTLSGEMFDSQGQNVTKDADKYGTGVVKSPSFAMRLFNPDAAQLSDEMNLKYNTTPAVEAQHYKIANAEADDYVRHAIAYAEGIKPEDVPQDKIKAVRSARGQSVTSSGLTPEQYNQMLSAISELKEGGPQNRGKLAAARTESELGSEKAFQDTGGPVKEGMARSKSASAAGEQATTIITNEPARRNIHAQRLAGEQGRLGIEEATLDQEAINRLARATNIDPQIIQRDAESLRREIGRQPTEEELRDYVAKNRLFAATNNEPLQLGVDLNRLKATNDSASLVRQSVMNQIRQQAAASSQPPGELMVNPTLYRPTGDMSGNPATMYKPQSTTNPLYRPGFLKQVAGMDFMPGGQQAISTGTVGGNRLTLPNGMVAMPVPVSAPATNSIIPPNNIDPNDPNALWTAIAKGLMNSNMMGPR